MAGEFGCNFGTTCTTTGDINVSIELGSCFSIVFLAWPNKRVCTVQYEIHLFKGEEILLKKKRSNACFLTLQELLFFLDYIRRFYPFQYEVIDTSEAYIINCVITGSEIQHKFLLTWIRYAYEFPYNVATKDAFVLKQTPGFKRINFFNLVHLCSITFINVSGGHSYVICNRFTLLTEQQVKTWLKSKPSSLNSLYRDKTPRGYCSETFKHKRVYDLAFWQDEECFENHRKPHYLDLINKCKKNP